MDNFIAEIRADLPLLVNLSGWCVLHVLIFYFFTKCYLFSLVDFSTFCHPPPPEGDCVRDRHWANLARTAGVTVLPVGGWLGLAVFFEKYQYFLGKWER